MPTISEFKHEIEPAYRTGRHEASATHRDDYHGEILPRIGTGYPDKPGQVMATEEQL
ncbi:hypothetical protein [Lunatibacter salilacus]|uniref:hypothetical protein n=1 Tax=Lunatibacter salilacus TaxID=2483804 RepID=UPI00131B3E59|nr:hypothetical protein [Lunatibacter salilacus]